MTDPTPKQMHAAATQLRACADGSDDRDKTAWNIVANYLDEDANESVRDRQEARRLRRAEDGHPDA